MALARLDPAPAGFTSVGCGSQRLAPLRESIGVADPRSVTGRPGFATHRRRAMALQQTLRERVGFQEIVRTLMVVGAVILGMLALNAIFGFNGAGPWTDLTTDPGAELGLPF